MTCQDTSKLYHSLPIGREIARTLADAAFFLRPENRKEIGFLAARIQHCNHDSNYYRADEYLLEDTGELIAAEGKLWKCGSKLCPSCVAAESRRNRKKLQKAIERQRLLVGERYRFITLTIPNPELSLLQTRDLIWKAWRKFSRCKWFKSRIAGYCKSEEFTVTDRGFHYHIHVLARAKYIDFAMLRIAWTAAVKHFWAEFFGEELKPATADQLLIVNCQNVRSIRDATNEVAKYITKADSWRKLSKRTLIEVASIDRWFRMFELGGTFATRHRSEKVSLSADEAAGKEPKTPINKTILDTESLTDSTQCESWRRTCRKLPTGIYAKRLILQIRNAKAFRIAQLRKKCPDARLECIDPPSNAEALAEARRLAAWISSLEYALEAL